MTETFEEKDIVIHIDKNGYITLAKNVDGTEIKYHPEEQKKLHGNKTRLLTPNDCCWRYTPQGWRCSPSYC